jgi:uncharacterized Ntn-hydrolase superfamily protein
VVPARGEPWQTVCELRVEDHPEPLAELRRLLALHEAYAVATEGDDLVGEGRTAEAGERYRRSVELAPGNDELMFWAGLALADAGDLEQGVAMVRGVIEGSPGWATLLERLDPDIAPGAATVRAALLS